MGERKGTNHYYPPDFDPGKGSLNAYHGTHALRERARKIHEGIIIIRFEMPYNIWCNGCGNHIGMGVRYNAQKRKVGNYYTTPIYKFRMKCHLCDQHFEIQTDPKNCEYVILSGARRKEERWDPAVTENIQTTDRDVKAKLVSDAMFKLEHSIEDKQKAKRAAPTLGKIQEMRDVWDDDFAVNQILRKKFREEKKEINERKIQDDEFKSRKSLPLSMKLAEESTEDADFAKRIRFGEDLRPDIKRRKRKQEIKQSAIFEKKEDSKGQSARHLAGLAKANSRVSSSMTSVFGDRSSRNVLIGKKGNLQRKDTGNKSNSPELKLNKDGNETADSEMNSGKGGENIVGSKEEHTASAGSTTDASEVMKDNNNGIEKSKTLATENDNSSDMQVSFLVMYSSSNDSCTSEEDT